MKILLSRKQLVPVLHLLFWFVSFNFWNFIFNPGIESSGVIQGLEVGWDFILPMNFLFLLYCTLPFVWLSSKPRLWIKIPVTLLFLAPIIYLIIVAPNPEKGNQNDVEEIFMEFFVKNFLYVLAFHLSVASAVYFNLKVLIARYLSKSKFGFYLLSALGFCILTALINFSFFNFFIDQLFPSLYFISYFRIWELILIVASYLVFTSILFLIWQYALMLIEKRDAARNELSALKAQINPHFLFNNLNTIYSMAEQKDERTSEVILKLSDFLRYILYDTSVETIPLEKEVEIIRTYVELQKERVNPESIKIEFITEGHFNKVNVAPLLLLPLAENCFKHGIGKDTGTIRIHISYDGKSLIFITENQVALREKTDTEENGGLGIQNVEKRLSLIYPDHHSLDYHEKDGLFHLEMKVELANNRG